MNISNSFKLLVRIDVPRCEQASACDTAVVDKATISGLRGLLALTLLATLSACGGKTITTVDNSADYKTAVSRPPLKKPSVVTTASKPKATQESKPTPSAGASPNEDTDINAESVTSSKQEAYIPGRNTAEVESDVDDAVNDSSSEVLSEGPETDTESLARGSLDARVISPKEGVSRLLVEAEFEAAWSYLNRSLQQSDVTVFSRNKAAGRFAIGCSGIDSAPTVSKKGGWSFLNKKSTLQQEYCALQAVATRGSTIVTVLNRFSEEVDGESSGAVFSRILNN